MILLGNIYTFLKFKFLFKFLGEMWRIFSPILNISLHWLWFRLTYSLFYCIGHHQSLRFWNELEEIPRPNLRYVNKFIQTLWWLLYGVCHSSCCKSAASPCWGLGSILDQSMWNLWLMKWHGDRFFTEYFDFPLSGLFQQCPMHIVIYHW